jgi:hypothetical protein
MLRYIMIAMFCVAALKMTVRIVTYANPTLFSHAVAFNSGERP